METIKYIISGLVQGVGYRYFVQVNARKLGLDGYAKNLYDGTVEVVAIVTKEKALELEKILKEGPSRAIVNNLTREKLDGHINISGFHIL